MIFYRRGSLPLPLILIMFVSMVGGLSCGSSSGENREMEKELRQLDALIKNLPKINRKNEARLDSMAKVYRLAKGSDKVMEALKLSNQYRLFNADSSLYYADAAIAESVGAGNRDLETRGRLERVTTLATLGIFTEARVEYGRFSPDTLNHELRICYYYAGRTLYSYMNSYLSYNPVFTESARKLYRQADDSLIALLPQKDPLREFLVGERLVEADRLQEAELSDLKLIEHLDPDTRLYAMTAFQLSTCYRLMGEREKMQLWLTRSAASDLNAGVRDGLALPTLANILYGQGRIGLAYSYITVSLQDAAAAGIRWRAFAIAEIVPNIGNAYHASIARQGKQLLVYSAIATLCLVISLGLLWFAVKQRTKLRRLASQLDEKSRLQNSYIGNFVAMCATYAERLSQMSSMVDRKLAAGDAEGLRKMIKSGKFLAADNDEFYTIFDNAFLDLYPDFVRRLNSLLREEEQLEWRPGKGLTPEMRIYALVCLGVGESTRIAQILHYSVSTVYAYRNRMRNRAFDRENFESDIQGRKESNLL